MKFKTVALLLAVFAGTACVYAQDRQSEKLKREIVKELKSYIDEQNARLIEKVGRMIDERLGGKSRPPAGRAVPGKKLMIEKFDGDGDELRGLADRYLDGDTLKKIEKYIRPYMERFNEGGKEFRLYRFGGDEDEDQFEHRGHERHQWRGRHEEEDEDEDEDGGRMERRSDGHHNWKGKHNDEDDDDDEDEDEDEGDEDGCPGCDEDDEII